jgi:hypothetical protein
MIVYWISATSEGYGLIYVVPPLAFAAILYVVNVACFAILVLSAVRHRLTARDRSAFVLSGLVMALPVAYWVVNDLTIH